MKITLSEDKEKILAKVSKLFRNPYSVFSKFVYAELPLPTIKDDKSNDMILNRSTSWRARSSPDRAYRKRGYEMYYGSLTNFKGTLAQNLAHFIEGKVMERR
ncbi:hypothetical protein ACFL27_28485 [candidate division CSSED10-310 bacterium]|uniref:Uncharacterized protein n=1 Tax=candidate division CSSED10-310 bacterium TaxID=2855610 RepID=A0ABV6Z6R3_UNCC1